MEALPHLCIIQLEACREMGQGEGREYKTHTQHGQMLSGTFPPFTTILEDFFLSYKIYFNPMPNLKGHSFPFPPGAAGIFT